MKKKSVIISLLVIIVSSTLIIIFIRERQREAIKKVVCLYDWAQKMTTPQEISQNEKLEKVWKTCISKKLPLDGAICFATKYVNLYDKKQKYLIDSIKAFGIERVLMSSLEIDIVKKAMKSHDFLLHGVIQAIKIVKNSVDGKEDLVENINKFIKPIKIDLSSQYNEADKKFLEKKTFSSFFKKNKKIIAKSLAGEFLVLGFQEKEIVKMLRKLGKFPLLRATKEGARDYKTVLVMLMFWTAVAEDVREFCGSKK